METKVERAGDMRYPAQVIRSGGLCAVPTETVYGLAGNGLDEEAVRRIYEVKGRPEEKAISLLISKAEEMSRLCEKVPEAARKLAEAYWPGPLTIVLKRGGMVPDIVAAGGETIGLRCPRHEQTLRLIELAGVPLAAPSANVTGHPSPRSVQEVLGYFDGKIECAIDGGTCEVGKESTIVDLSGEEMRIIRHGALSEEEIRKVIT